MVLSVDVNGGFYQDFHGLVNSTVLNQCQKTT